MKRLIPFISFTLNVGLLAAIFFALRQPTEEVSKQPGQDSASGVTQIVKTVTESNTMPPIASAPFDWTQIESDEFPTYAENLRGIGCPEETVRDILTAAIEQFFVQHRQELFRPRQNIFWDLMAQDFDELIDDELRKKLDTLDEEKASMLKEIVGVGSDMETPHQQPGEYELVLGELLSPEKVQQLRAISDQVRKMREEFELANPDHSDKQRVLAAFSKKLESDQERLLSPEELEEFRLRKSPFAQQLQGMIGFEATGDELRALARLRLDETPEGKMRVEEQTRALLGEKRFGEFLRSTNSSFHDLHRIARRYDLPQNAIAETYELVRAATERVDAIESSKKMSIEHREAALENFRGQTQSALISKLGFQAAEAYRRSSGDWNQVARP